MPISVGLLPKPYLFRRRTLNSQGWDPIVSDMSEFKWRGGQVTRIEALTDAVFGFAITFLFVSFDVPNDFDALVRRMHRGLIVTELLGHGVNLVTGDYSRGAAGFWVENGSIQYPVHEITIAGNLADMFRQIVGIGDDIDKRGNIHTGAILVEQMMVAGK